MASHYKSLIAVFFVLLSLHIALSSDVDPHEAPPSPSPVPASDNFSISSAPTYPPSQVSDISYTPSLPPSSSNLSNPPSPTPSQSPHTSSPSPTPSQSPYTSSPSSTPSESPAPSTSESDSSPTPAPAPVQFADENLEDGDKQKSTSGMSGGKKAGISIGVVLAAGTVVVGGCIYKKRQENIRRSRYGYTARAGMI